MTMITVSNTVRSEAQVEVEFPVYRHYGGWSWDVFERWDADGTEYSITENHGHRDHGFEIEISRRPLDGGGSADSADFILGRGQYVCTVEEYRTAHARAIALFGKASP